MSRRYVSPKPRGTNLSGATSINASEYYRNQESGFRIQESRCRHDRECRLSAFIRHSQIPAHDVVADDVRILLARFARRGRGQLGLAAVVLRVIRENHVR